MNQARRSRPLRIAAAMAVLAALFMSAAGIASAAYVGSISTATTVVASPAEVQPGQDVTLTATVSPDPDCGSVRFTYNGTATDVAVAGPGTAATTVTTVAGSLQATAEFLGCGEYSSSTGTTAVVARHTSTTTLAANRSTAVRFEQPVTLTATVAGPVAATGTVTFRRLDGATQVTVGTGSVSGGVATLVTGSLPVGTVQLVAGYGGSTVLKASTSAPITVTITPDPSVKVADVGVQWLRLYPVKDGYKDTDAIRGRTLEPATVTIRIYNSSGTRVRYWALGSKNGAYSITWTGRTNGGTILPAGTYSVQQSFQDQAGNTLVVKHDVVLSHKKLVWVIGSQTRYANSGAFFSDGYADTYRSQRYSKGMVLDGGYFTTDSARARFTFTLPAATAYSSVRVSVYGRSITPYGRGFMRFYRWSDGAGPGKESVGYSTAWHESSEPASALVNTDRKVQAWVLATGTAYSVVDFQKVKLTYKYGVLR